MKQNNKETKGGKICKGLRHYYVKAVEEKEIRSENLHVIAIGAVSTSLVNQQRWINKLKNDDHFIITTKWRPALYYHNVKGLMRCVSYKFHQQSHYNHLHNTQYYTTKLNTCHENINSTGQSFQLLLEARHFTCGLCRKCRLWTPKLW